MQNDNKLSCLCLMHCTLWCNKRNHPIIIIVRTAW